MAASGSLSNAQIGRLAGAIGKPVLRSIAQDFMDISPETLTNYDQEFGTDIHGFNRKVFQSWKNKNYGGNQSVVSRSVMLS